MITISVCMIVKNEEKVLKRCLYSLAPIADEIIIVDTGSTDRTKEIASEFTDKIYDFQWINDFSAARNYSFEKASMDYIYIADADEVIDQENLNKFISLKQYLLTEVDIVQMYYDNQLQYNTTYNFNKEYRPKLFKRLRTFTWQDPIHESVRLEPLIYDSDIAILHMPEESHAQRDFKIFENLIDRKEVFSEKMIRMYARELYVCGKEEDFIKSAAYFEALYEKEANDNLNHLCECILIRYYRMTKNMQGFLKIALHNAIRTTSSSEVCYEIGEFYYELGDYKEATIWFYNAVYETECELNIHYGGDFPLKRLSDCFSQLGNSEQAKEYERLAKEFATS